MKYPVFGRRTAIAAFALACASLGANAQATWPSRAISIVVPYASGGSTDALARMLGQKISVELGQPVLIDNKGGAASNVGVGYVAKAQPDGYTLGLVTSTAMSVNPGMYKQLPFDAETSFEPILLATTLPSVVIVNAALPVDSLKALNAYLKLPSTRSQYGTAGGGSAPHLGAELYRAGVGFESVHIPYKGGAPALMGLVAGDTTFMVAVTPEAMPLVKSGKLKALAVTSLQRLPDMPNLPTVSEAAIPGYELIWGFGFVAPKGTPKEIVNRLNGAFNRALADPEVATKLKGMGYVVAGGEPSGLTNLMRKDRIRYKQMIDRLNISPD